MTAVFHHRSLVSVIRIRARTFGLDVELRQHVVAEDLEEPVLGLADVVQVDLVETQLGQVGQVLGVGPGIGGDEHRLLDVLEPGHLRRGVEGLDVVQVPADRRGEDVGPPLVVRDGPASSSVSARSSGGPGSTSGPVPPAER